MYNNSNIVFFGLLFILYSQGALSLTQLLLLFTLMSTENCPCGNSNDTRQTLS